MSKAETKSDPKATTKAETKPDTKGAGKSPAPKTGKAETTTSTTDAPKRTQNRRNKTYTVQKLARMVPLDSVQSANDAVTAAITAIMTKGGAPSAETISNAAIEANNTIMRDDSAQVWVQVAEVEDLAGGDKWILENGEADTAYRVAIVTDSIELEVEQKVVRRVKL